MDDYDDISFYDKWEMVYFAKRFFDIGQYSDLTCSIDDEFVFDSWIQMMWNGIASVFPIHKDRFYEKYCSSLYVFSSDEVENYFINAGIFGELLGLNEDKNPFIQKAHNYARRCFNFSYAVDWQLYGYTKPKRPYQSRLAIIAYEDSGDVPHSCILAGLLDMRQWIAMKNKELSKKIERIKLLKAGAAA